MYFETIGISDVRIQISRCNILICTVFHHPARINVNTCPIPWLHKELSKWCTPQPRGAYKQVFRLCTPLVCIGKWWHIGMLHRDQMKYS